MPKTLNPIKKAKVKKALLKGKSIRQALKEAGYAAGTQRGKNNGTTNSVVKVCQKEIALEFRAKELSVDKVINDIETAKRLALKSKKKDLSTYMRGCELLGKYLQMWSDNNVNIQVNSKEAQFTINERIERLKGNTE